MTSIRIVLPPMPPMVCNCITDDHTDTSCVANILRVPSRTHRVIGFEPGTPRCPRTIRLRRIVQLRVRKIPLNSPWSCIRSLTSATHDGSRSSTIGCSDRNSTVPIQPDTCDNERCPSSSTTESARIGQPCATKQLTILYGKSIHAIMTSGDTKSDKDRREERSVHIC